MATGENYTIILQYACAQNCTCSPLGYTYSKMEQFGADVLLERAGQPSEIAHSYVFLAGEGASYMTGQVLHPNGGTIVGG